MSFTKSPPWRNPVAIGISSPSGRGDTAPDNPLDNPLDMRKMKSQSQSIEACIILRREVSKNETFWNDSDPWRIFSTPSRGLWDFPRALTYIYGITTSFVVEPACATVTSPQSEV